MRGCGKPFDFSISCSYSRALSADHDSPCNLVMHGLIPTPLRPQKRRLWSVDDVLSIRGPFFCHLFDPPHELLAV